MNRHDSPDMVRLHNASPDDGESKRRPWWLIPIASGLLVAVVIAAIVFVATRASVAGNWYGPGNFEGNNTSVATAMYFQLSQQLTGSISGSGQICVRNANGVVQAPVTVEGSLSGSNVKLTVHLNAAGSGAGDIPLTQTLEMQGTFAEGAITLSGTAPPGLLTLQSGSQADYTTACDNLLAAAQAAASLV